MPKTIKQKVNNYPTRKISVKPEGDQTFQYTINVDRKITAPDYPTPLITAKTLLSWLKTGDNRKIYGDRTPIDGSYTPWVLRFILLPFFVADLLRRK